MFKKEWEIWKILYAMCPRIPASVSRTLLLVWNNFENFNNALLKFWTIICFFLAFCLIFYADISKVEENRVNDMPFVPLLSSYIYVLFPSAFYSSFSCGFALNHFVLLEWIWLDITLNKMFEWIKICDIKNMIKAELEG